ncbi:hypothetical protein ACFL5V_13700, partial [Fibrobacterota bacterium]
MPNGTSPPGDSTTPISQESKQQADFFTPRFPALISCLVIFLLLISGCANFRAYFNAYYNAQKAFDRAERLKTKRLKKNPLDSID